MKNANYEIIELEPTYEEYGNSFGVALGYNEKTKMWVTWCYKQSTQDKTEIDFFWGHYFDRQKDAIVDYHTRIINDLQGN